MMSWSERIFSQFPACRQAGFKKIIAEHTLRNYFFWKNGEKIDRQKLHLLFFHSLLKHYEVIDLLFLKLIKVYLIQ